MDTDGFYSHATSRKGFTLIELLVVIAIIAVLAAILFPVFIMAKEAGRKSKCLGNLKQMASAMDLYKGDWNGNFTSSATYPSPVGEWSAFYYSFWMPMLDRYHKARDLYRCPSALTTEPYAFPGDEVAALKRRYSAANYGINEYLIFYQWGGWYKESSLPNPTKTLLFADCSWVLIMDWTTMAGPDGVVLPQGMLRAKYANTPASAFRPNWMGDVSKFQTRHGDRVQIVFADGHARSVHFREFVYWGPASAPNPKDTNINIVEYPILHPMARPPQ